MNANLTHREWLRQTPTPRATAEPLVQMSEAPKERLAREILAVSGPMNQRNAVKYQHYLLTLDVDVLRGRLAILVKEATDGHE